MDLRVDSPSFGKWTGVELTGDNHLELLVPEQFGHGYLVIEDSIVSYKCAEVFYGEYDTGIKWDDPTIGIEWNLDRVGGIENIVISEKDKKLPKFREVFGNDY